MVRFVKKYLVLMVVAVLFVGAFLLNLRTNAAKTEPVGSDAFEIEEAQETEHVSDDYLPCSGRTGSRCVSSKWSIWTR